MLSKGPAKKVTIYLNEDTQHHFETLHESILTFLMHKGVAGATAFRGMAGFGSHRLLHTRRVEVLAEHLPILVEFVESAEKVDELLPTLYEMVTDGLIEVQETNVVKMVRKEKKTETRLPHGRQTGPAKLMRVFFGEADRWKEEPLYEAIVKRLRMMDVSGATVYRGILGYGAKGHTHKASFLHLSRDMPIMISVVDSPAKIAEAAAAVEEMLEDGLIAVSDVDMTRLVRSGLVPEDADAGKQPG